MEAYRKKIWLLATISLLVHTGFGIIFPIFPKVLEDIGRGASSLGVLAAAFGLTYFIFSPVFGYAADKFGKKRIILIGLLGFAVSNLIYVEAILIGNYWLILTARIIEGAFSSAVFPAAIAMVSDIVPETERGRNIGIVTAGNGIGLIIGPLFGGLLFEYSIHTPFYLSAILAMITVVWAYWTLPNPKKKNNSVIKVAKTENTEKKTLVTMIKENISNFPNPKIVFFMFILVDISITISWLIVEPGFSFYIYDDLNLEPRDFGTFIAAYGLTVAIGEGLMGSLSDKYGRRPLILLGLSLNGIFYVLMIYAKTSIHLILAAAVAGVGLGFVGPAMKALLSDAANDDNRATVMSVASGLAFTSAIIGPLFGGVLYDKYGITLLFYLAIIISLLGLVLASFLKFDKPNSITVLA